MAIKVYRKNRAARRQASIEDRSLLYKGKPQAKLLSTVKKRAGRGRNGKITVRHHGGGAKRRYRVIDFGQSKQGVKARVERVEFDPNRSGYIALLLFADGERRYVLAWEGAKEGDTVIIQEDAVEKTGNRLQLRHITPGMTVFNAELAPGRGGKLFRSAGSAATVMDVQKEQVILKLPSGEIRMVSNKCWATVGVVSNADHRLVRIGSAGRKRRKGRRPQVRGKAMNPVDHPHGGGEGLQPIGLKHPKTKWGKPAYGVKTRRSGKQSDRRILKRRKSKRQ